tara:strand:- start:877 stop:1050 length:174 start_codon:yes stop_codon:yes gene_type:complete
MATKLKTMHGFTLEELEELKVTLDRDQVNLDIKKSMVRVFIKQILKEMESKPPERCI